MTGAVLDTLRSGPPDAPLVMCLHGIGADARSFALQAEGLADAWRVVAVNLPGYGRSPLPEDGLTFPAMAERVMALLDVMGAPAAHFVGHSMGGMVVQELLACSPGRVLSATLVATTSVFGSRDGEFQKQFVATRLAPLDAGNTLRELAPAIVRGLMGDAPPASAVALAEQGVADVPEATFRAAVHCLSRFDRRQATAQAGVPVQLIAGERDRQAPARAMARMHERIPGSRYHCEAGAGHFVHLERATEVNAILRAFLESIDAAGSTAAAKD